MSLKLWFENEVLEKLTALMNLSKPLTANKYDKIVIRLNIVLKEVANETIRENSEDLLFKSKNTNDDTVIHTIVSCDGGWHKSGYSSLDSVATVISMDNGKFFDTEPMARICKSCLLHAKLRNLIQSVLKITN